MSRTHRALTVLALSLALATATSAVAVAAEDLNAQRKALYQAQLEQNLAGRTASTQSVVEQARAGEREFAAAVAQPVAPVEDQNDRLLRGVEAAQAERTRAAVEQARAGERSLDPAPVVTIAPQPVPAAAGRGIDPPTVLLLGLVGGLAGGAAILAGWTAANRRHARRVVAA
jgi:hypothetical protein